jgi:hypothetical protein
VEDGHPLEEHRDAEEIRFDSLALLERAFQVLSELRTADLSKHDFMLILGLFNKPLARLMWEFYNATTEDE